MQRAEALQPLSRQHKSALMACLLIRKGISKQAPLSVITDFLLKTWEEDIQPHFVEEETKLLPLLNQYPEGKQYGDTILRDHDLIRTGINHLRQEGVNYRLLGDLADQIDQHVRYEERIVFQEMQSFLTTSELSKLNFEEENHNPVCNRYPDHFWE
ncbi:MAG TPA: hemerythrin domain-containing protein [Chitinophagaceae bacterium]